MAVNSASSCLTINCLNHGMVCVHGCSKIRPLSRCAALTEFYTNLTIRMVSRANSIVRNAQLVSAPVDGFLSSPFNLTPFYLPRREPREKMARRIDTRNLRAYCKPPPLVFFFRSSFF